MFNFLNQVFVPVAIGVSILVYGILVSYMMKNTRYREIIRNMLGFSSTSEKAERFYEMLLKALKNDLINNIDDVLNMYIGITGYSYDHEEKRYYLVRRLRKFLVFMIKQDGLGKEDLKKWKGVITEYIKELETETPYVDVPSSERRILLEIDRLIIKGECNGIKGRLDDLAGMIQNRNEDQNRLIRINRWSVPLTIVGLILTILFGGLSLYLTFRPPNNIAKPTITTPQAVEQKSDIANSSQ